MQTAKVFQSGKTQAVQLPNEFHFGSERVYVKRVGNAIVILPGDAPWENLLNSLSLFSADFMNERSQPPTQDR
jgi:antitoxin VapB